jgi:hypothetical protein
VVDFNSIDVEQDLRCKLAAGAVILIFSGLNLSKFDYFVGVASF